MIYAASL